MRRFLAGLFLYLAATSAAFAIDLPQLAQFTNSNWLLAGAPALDMNFAAGLYWGTSPTQLSVTRASAESEVCNGFLTTFPVNVPAITPGCGLWDWEARTNPITNNQPSGNAQPATWTGSGTSNGITATVVNTSVTNGMSCITYNFAGTATATFGDWITFANYTNVAAAYGQTWSESVWVSATNTTNLAAATGPFMYETSSVGAGITQHRLNTLPSTSLTQVTQSATLTNTGTAYLNVGYQLGITSGAAYNLNITLCIPQVELNPNLPASVASAVAASSGTGGVNGTAVYTVTGGTCTTAPTLNVTWSAGVLTVNSVANAGSCSVLPPSPATLAYASGAATGWTGATVTLTPTDNSASAFATGPILTTGTAATRAANVITAPLRGSTKGGLTIAIAATPYAPATFPGNQYWIEADDGTEANRSLIFRATLSGFTQSRYTIASSNVYSGVGLLAATRALSKSGQSVRDGAQLFSTNGSAATPGTGSGSFTYSQLNIGSGPAGINPLNGVISRVTAWTTALSQSQLNAATH